MIVENCVQGFHVCSAICLPRRGLGESKMIMHEGGKENLVGPALYVLPDGTSKFYDPAIHVRVTDRVENLTEGIVMVESTRLRVVWLRDATGFLFQLHLWHFRLVFP